MKKLFSLFVIVTLAVSLFAQGQMEESKQSQMRSFTDDLGRVVSIEEEITKVAPSGSMAQVVLLTFDPSLLVGTTTKTSADEAAYYSSDISKLPVFGTFYGKKANLNKEALMVAAPQVVIDIGEIKGSKEDMIADLDTLQSQIGIPVVFIESYLTGTANTYTRLGELLGMEERGEELSAFAEEAIEYAAKIKGSEKTDKTFYYSSSSDGLMAIPKGNFHGEVLEEVGGINAVSTKLASGNNQISLEELYNLDPDYIFLSDSKAFEEVTTSNLWSTLSAVENENVYMIPDLINNWIDSPPSVNRLIGIYYVAEVLYPEVADVNTIDKAKEFYDLFYGYELKEGDLSIK